MVRIIIFIIIIFIIIIIIIVHHHHHHHQTVAHVQEEFSVPFANTPEFESHSGIVNQDKRNGNERRH
jgi:preprotein translocase subunit SecG